MLRYVPPVVNRRDTGELVSARAPANVLERTTAEVSLLAGILASAAKCGLGTGRCQPNRSRREFDRLMAPFDPQR